MSELGQVVSWDRVLNAINKNGLGNLLDLVEQVQGTRKEGLPDSDAAAIESAKIGGSLLGACNDPVKFCSGVTVNGVTHERSDGRRDQALDVAA
jgi:hypothetical protein